MTLTIKVDVGSHELVQQSLTNAVHHNYCKEDLGFPASLCRIFREYGKAVYSEGTLFWGRKEIGGFTPIIRARATHLCCPGSLAARGCRKWGRVNSRLALRYNSVGRQKGGDHAGLGQDSPVWTPALLRVLQERLGGGPAAPVGGMEGSSLIPGKFSGPLYTAECVALSSAVGEVGHRSVHIY